MKTRRSALKTLLIALPGIARAQQFFRASVLPALILFTTKTTGFHPVFTKTGATLYWKWPDGTFTSSNGPTKTLAAGTKRVEVQSQDGFQPVTVITLASQNFTGTLPSFAAFTGLTDFQFFTNAFSGSLPSFASNTALVTFFSGGNSFSGSLPSFAGNTSLVNFACNACSYTGTLPSFAACTLLATFYCYTNGFSGTLPSFAPCTALVTFHCYSNAFSGTFPDFSACTLLQELLASANSLTAVVAGSFATQKSLAVLSFSTNALPSAQVNQVLADCVASLGGGRVVCNLGLAGGTNGAPTGQGILDKATLIVAGWTVSTN